MRKLKNNKPVGRFDRNDSSLSTLATIDLFDVTYLFFQNMSINTKIIIKTIIIKSEKPGGRFDRTDDAKSSLCITFATKKRI